jgi:hypothetical protein
VAVIIPDADGQCAVLVLLLANVGYGSTLFDDAAAPPERVPFIRDKELTGKVEVSTEAPRISYHAGAEKGDFRLLSGYSDLQHGEFRLCSK